MALIKGLLSTLLLTAGVSISARVILDMPPSPGAAAVYSAPLPARRASLSGSAFTPPLGQRSAPGSASGMAFKTGLAPFSATIIIGHGGNLAETLAAAGASRTEAAAAAEALAKLDGPRSITEGREITVNFTPRFGVSPSMGIPGRFEGFSFMPEHPRLITVSRTGRGGFAASMVERKMKRSLARAAFVIEDSLFDAAAKAGLPALIQAELVRIFSWDIDFQRDIRPGDGFEIMFERYRGKHGDLIHEGRILYAALFLSGHARPIYYHVTRDGTKGYFKKNGQSARRALMRTPIDGARLSSGFGARKHPILGYMKQHRGVDFAAPPGTPVFAAGGGVVEKAGLNGFYGKYVRIRHNREYATAYAHMSRIAVQAGKRVRQGQVIGYVGSSGRVTGPHLHYEILKNSQRANPLKINMPSGRTLKGAELGRFKETIAIADYQRAYLAEGAAKPEAARMANAEN